MKIKRPHGDSKMQPGTNHSTPWVSHALFILPIKHDTRGSLRGPIICKPMTAYCAHPLSTPDSGTNPPTRDAVIGLMAETMYIKIHTYFLASRICRTAYNKWLSENTTAIFRLLGTSTCKIYILYLMPRRLCQDSLPSKIKSTNK